MLGVQVATEASGLRDRLGRLVETNPPFSVSLWPTGCTGEGDGVAAAAGGKDLDLCFRRKAGDCVGAIATLLGVGLPLLFRLSQLARRRVWVLPPNGF